MNNILKLEEAMMLALSLFLFRQENFSWTWFAILFLAPDLGLLGYLVNSKTGAVMYNVAHHKGLAILIYLSGIYFSIEQLQFAGILMFAHSSFDRIFGYGLKYPDSFHNTHLGMIGRKKIN
jgi:Domain of unknown function (DUF4260)